MKENELSEFMQYAYQTGRVRDVQEAFEEFDPENEWHKGRIEEYKASFKQLEEIKNGGKNGETT